MIGNLSVHRTDNRDLIDMRGGLLKDLAHLDSAFPITPKCERGWECSTSLSFGSKIVRDRLSCMFVQCRLGVEGIDVGWATVEEEMDDPFGTTRKMRLLRLVATENARSG